MSRASEIMETVLSSTFALYLKTHAYHWNVTGPNFPQLHTLFEEHYTEMWNALDEIAESLRITGSKAPTNAAALVASSVIEEEQGCPDAETMVETLVTGHKALVGVLKDSLAELEELGDTASADVVTQRISAHEKMRWMLESTAK